MGCIAFVGRLVRTLSQTQNVFPFFNLLDGQLQLMVPVGLEADIVFAAKALFVIAVSQSPNHIDTAAASIVTYDRVAFRALVPWNKVYSSAIFLHVRRVIGPEDNIYRYIATIGLPEMFQSLIDVVNLARPDGDHVDDHGEALDHLMEA